jgi:ribonuclease HI
MARGAFQQKEETKEISMTNKQQETARDQLFFDGSAEPNPGGRMGAGWRLVFTDRPEETGAAEWPAARDNTNNRAEYLALIGALLKLPRRRMRARTAGT